MMGTELTSCENTNGSGNGMWQKLNFAESRPQLPTQQEHLEIAYVVEIALHLIGVGR